MKKRNFTKEDKGVAGVIEALLIVALVAIVISTIQLVYIPQVMNQREADHMDEVANQFSSMKAMIDLQSLTAKDVPISSPITLGSRELPYFVTARALGELSIVDSTGKIEVNDELEDIAKLTAIKYEAFNSYFVHQTYLLEGGGIIVKQPDGEPVMRVDPPISVENKSTINIYYAIPIIVGIAGKDLSATDYKTCFIRTNYSDRSDDDWIQRASVSRIRITTNYTSAWNESLHDLLGNNANITSPKGSNYVEVTPNGKDIYLHYKKIYIYAQISPGWIE